MFSIFVNTLSATVPHDISPTTTIGEIKKMVSKSEKIPLRNFDLWFQDQQLSDLVLTADACGITRDCFVTISEKPLNEVIVFSFVENFAVRIVLCCQPHHPQIRFFSISQYFF